MNAWVIDARIYDAGKDLTESTLFQSIPIRDYLSQIGAGPTVVIAPKGYGKTLLIKHKRKKLERSGYSFVPPNVMVEVNTGKSPNFSNDDLASIDAMPDFWSQLWQISISVAVTRAAGRIDGADQLRQIAPQLLSVDWAGPFEVFEHLLRKRLKEYHEVYDAYCEEIRPIFRRIHEPMAVFVDNIDEYFLPHLAHTRLGINKGYGRNRVFGQLSRSFWDSAQVGFLQAVRALHSLNPHVKIFGAIRSEAYNSFKGELQESSNDKAYFVQLDYSEGDLRSIFEKNILANSKRAPRHNSATNDPFEQFAGPNNVNIRHINTGKMEHIFDYCLRHTLSRPRDLIRIGKRIDELEFMERTADNLRHIVNDEAIRICSDYLAETREQFVWFDEETLFSLINSYDLSREALQTIVAQYRERSSIGLDDSNDFAIFADLYHAGLLGVVSQNGDVMKKTQRFMPVRDIGSSSYLVRRDLPESDRYLIHPLLGSYLTNLHPNGQNYIDSINIISAGADWIEDTNIRFVLMMDVEKSTKILSDPLTEETFRADFRNLIQKFGKGTDYFDIEGGDAAMLIDRSSYLLLRKANLIHNFLRERYNCSARFGLERGMIDVIRSDSGKDLKGGPHIPRAARLRDCSEPGFITLLEHTRQEIEYRNFHWPIHSITQQRERGAVRAENGWLLGKGDKQEFVANLFSLKIDDIVI